jgi:hypothetical protein
VEPKTKRLGALVSKKDILGNGFYMPTEVGANIYVWSEGGRKPTGQRACVITAHGMNLPADINSRYPTPNVTLYFYAPHGRQLSDAGAAGVLRGTAKYYEKFGPTNCSQDYSLTKAQGYHSAKAKEHYSDFQMNYHPDPAKAGARQLRDVLLQGVNKKSKLADVMAQGIERDYQTAIANFKDLIMDVVSIRNRQWPHLQKEQTLFGVIAQLERAGFKYSDVHCYFCRGAADTWQVNDNTSPG